MLIFTDDNLTSGRPANAINVVAIPQYQPTDVVCIIPAMNEELVVGSVVASLVSQGFRAVVINDGSSDRTKMVAEAAGALVISHAINVGQGAALETGFEAIRRGLVAGPLVATFDADGQHSVEGLLSMIAAFNEDPRLDVVLGSRFSGSASEVPMIKGLLLRLAALLARVTLRIAITDRHNGIRMFRDSALTKIVITVPGYGHADEILRAVSRWKLNFKEVGVHVAYTEYSKSKGQPLINAARIVFDSLVERR
jgi:glycosyltransferase involved in cell wall biosynthesis